MLKQRALVEPDPFQQILFLMVMRYERNTLSLLYYGYLVWHVISLLLIFTIASQKATYNDFPDEMASLNCLNASIC
jgi:hypothetical protein